MKELSNFYLIVDSETKSLADWGIIMYPFPPFNRPVHKVYKQLVLLILHVAARAFCLSNKIRNCSKLYNAELLKIAADC